MRRKETLISGMGGDVTLAIGEETKMYMTRCVVVALAHGSKVPHDVPAATNISESSYNPNRARIYGEGAIGSPMLL